MSIFNRSLFNSNPFTTPTLGLGLGLGLNSLESMNRDINTILRTTVGNDVRGVNGNAISAGEWFPAVDIKETASHYVVLADVPGVNPRDINVALENDYLVIQGARAEIGNTIGSPANSPISAHTNSPVSYFDTNSMYNLSQYNYRERTQGTFYRQFRLPRNIDTNSIDASFSNGVLTVQIAKKEAANSRTVNIQVK